jgi:hypothetical protein
MPFSYELAAANVPERVVASELLERCTTPGQVIIGDKGFAGRDFEQLVLDLDCEFRRPDRHGEPERHGNLGGIRQWVESIIWRCKGHLSLERHGARTLPGLCARSANACSPSPPASGITTASDTHPCEPSPAMTTDSERTI